MRAVTLSDALTAAAATPRQITMVEHDGRSVTMPYAALLAESLLIAGALVAAGYEPEDRIALMLTEVRDFICVFFALAAAGLVPVPLVPPGQAGDLPTFTRQARHLLKKGRVRAVVTSAGVQPLVDVVGLDPAPAVLTVDSLRSAPPLRQPIHVPMSATALLQFTSGSTAAPKGVVLTHDNIQANVSVIDDGLRLTSSDVAVSWLPLYHDMGLIGMLVTAIYAKVDSVIISPILFLKRPTMWLEALSRHRGTISFAPNFAYDLCLRRVKRSQIPSLDLTAWRVAGCGAEPVRAETLHTFANYFAPAGFQASSFVPSYGLAEHSLAVTFSHGGITTDTVDADRLVCDSHAAPAAGNPNGARTVRLVSCGRPFPGHEIRIVDPNGEALPERQLGQIVARGPSVMSGYFEDPDATDAAVHDGWLQTGDLGYIAGGDLFVCGRTKDLIIREGHKYHPPDLESAILDVAGLRSSGVVVFGINRVAAADEVVAVLEARASNAPDTIVDHVRRRVRETAGLELDRVVVAPPGTIPRTTSGKVRRAETRARFQAGTLLTGGLK